MCDCTPTEESKSWDGVKYALIVFFAVLLAILFFWSNPSDDVRKDSQGVPCTISTAQNADGTPECQ
jgi:hypothetical protein